VIQTFKNNYFPFDIFSFKTFVPEKSVSFDIHITKFEADFSDTFAYCSKIALYSGC